MSECGSTRTCSSSGDGEDYCSATEVVIVEGFGKYRDGKRWKQRFCVLSKLSPAADCLQLQVYRDEKERARNGHTKASLSLQHFLAVESGFTLDRESHTLAIICQDLNVVLAFDNRERLIQWSVRIANNLGEGQQFLVQLASAPVKSKLNPGPVKLHVTDKRFCLTGCLPPRLLGSWEISQLRRYGLVDGRLVFEGGSRCGKGEGVHVLVPDPPQLSHIIDAFDMSSKGQLTRMPSRRFGAATDSPRKTLGIGNRFSEMRPLHQTDSSNNGSMTPYNLTLSPTPRESRSAEELCSACTDAPAGPNTFWMSSETSSRCDLDSCDNLSVIASCPQNNVRTSSPVKQTIAKPLPSAMERCLSCMSKLGQGGQLQPHDVLSPSWTMDLSSNTGCHNTSIGSGNSDRLSISSHGSSGGGGVTEYCYDTPRSVLMNEMRRNHSTNRSSTPPALHGCCSNNSSITSCHRSCAHPNPTGQSRGGCESPQRNPMMVRNGCATHVQSCQCQHHHAQQQSGGQGPIYYSIPEQPSSKLSLGNENKAAINPHSYHGPYENYDFPRVVNPAVLLQTSQNNCCNGNGNICGNSCSSSTVDWAKKQPMDRSSVATTAQCSDAFSDWYDTPRRSNETPLQPHCSNTQGVRACQCCPTLNNTGNNVQMQPGFQQQQFQCPSTFNPLENYDVPQPSAMPVLENFQNTQRVSAGRVNGEGKMPLVASSSNSMPMKIFAPNSQAIYAQVDKSKKTPRPLPPQTSASSSTCDNQHKDAQCHQPVYINVVKNQDSPNMNNTSPRPTLEPAKPKTVLIPLKPNTQNQQHSNYVNLDFVDSLQLYENSKELVLSRASVAVAAVAVASERVELVENIQIQRNVVEQKTEVKVLKEIQETKDVEIDAKCKESQIVDKVVPQTEKTNHREKVENDGEVALPLRRSSSVPCKGGHANRGSASSSDSGVSGDGGLFFDDCSPSNDFGNLCLHESLPRKGQRTSPGSTSGKNPSISSTPKPQSSEESEVQPNIQASNSKEVQVQVQVHAEQEKVQQNDLVEDTRLSPKHYETIDEIEPVVVVKVMASCAQTSSKNSESITRRTLKNPTSSLVSDTNSTSSGASDMSDYIDTLSSCSRGSMDNHPHSSSSLHAHHHLVPNISASPKKSTNMKPRSGKEYFKIDRAMLAKQN